MAPTAVKLVPIIRPRVLVAAAGVCGVLSALVWHARGPVGWERPLIVLLRHEPPPFARALLLAWQPFPLIVATLGVAWLASQSGRFRLAVSGTIACVLALFVTERVLKPVVGRHHLYAGSAVFPSAHVTAAAAWAMFAWLVVDSRSPLRPALLAVPAVVSWAAIATRAHYPADALAGALVGGLVVYCTVLVVERVGSARQVAVIDLRGNDQDSRSVREPSVLRSPHS